MEEKKIEVTDEMVQEYAKGGGIPKAIRKEVVEKLREKNGKNKEVVHTRSGLNLFIDEFLSNGGNATEAAWQVFNCSNRASAAAMGGQYLKQAKNLGVVRAMAEKHGYGLDNITKLVIRKANESDNPQFLDRLLKMTGNDDIIPGKAAVPGVVNIIQTQKTLQDEFGFTDGEIVPAQDEDV